MSPLSQKVEQTLGRHLTPVSVHAIMKATCARAGVSPKQITFENLPQLCVMWERALRVYVDEHKIDAALADLAQLQGDDDSATETDARPDSSRPVATELDLCQVRLEALDLARNIGFHRTEALKVATVVSELARNILQYAREGSISLKSLDDGRVGVQIIARDNGPGIADIDEVLSGGYKSKTGMGLGLCGSKRLVDKLTVNTLKGRGTTVRVWKYA